MSRWIPICRWNIVEIRYALPSTSPWSAAIGIPRWWETPFYGPTFTSTTLSQTMFPSSSYDANRFMSDEAATINEVETSNTMLEYGRERGTEREGRWASSWTSGIHSTRLGPWACHTISLCVAICNTPNAYATHCSSNNRHVPLRSTAGSLPSTPTASMS